MDKMYKQITFLMVACLAMTVTAIGQDQKANVEIEYLFELGGDIELGEDGYLLMPYSAAFDRLGNIYVSDWEFKHIAMFNQSGGFLQYFGGEGRGPGEFLDISGMDTDSKGQLLVYDRMQFKMVRFDTETGNIEEYPIEDMNQPNMMTLQSLSENHFAGIYTESNVEDQSEGVVRIYEFGERSKQSSHFSYFEYLFDPEIPLEKRLATGIFHKFHKLNDRELILGHSVYTGKHFHLDIETDSVITVENPAIDAPYFIEFEERIDREGPRISGVVNTFGRGGDFFYQMLYQSIIYGTVESGEWIHIYRKNQPNSAEYVDYMEVYNSDNRLIYHDEISAKIPEEEELFYRQYLSISSSGHLMVLDRFELTDPKLKLFQVDINR